MRSSSRNPLKPGSNFAEPGSQRIDQEPFRINLTMPSSFTRHSWVACSASYIETLAAQASTTTNPSSRQQCRSKVTPHGWLAHQTRDQCVDANALTYRVAHADRLVDVQVLRPLPRFSRYFPKPSLDEDQP
jgi:hypothetical protein